MSKQIEHVQFVSTLLKGRKITIESFDIVAVCGNKVECCFDNVACCFDIVAGVDGALVVTHTRQVPRGRSNTENAFKIMSIHVGSCISVQMRVLLTIKHAFVPPPSPLIYQLLVGFGRIPKTVLGTSGGARPPQSTRGCATVYCNILLHMDTFILTCT